MVEGRGAQEVQTKTAAAHVSEVMGRELLQCVWLLTGMWDCDTGVWTRIWETLCCGLHV